MTSPTRSKAVGMALWVSLLANALLIVILVLSRWTPYSWKTDANKDIEAYLNQHNYVDIGNASAIFNTVHGSLKQRNADLNPVGVSFIPAYIPPNTPLYHSTGSPDVPDTLEWIAMDFEFSYSFAHARRHNRDPNSGPWRPGPPGNHPPPPPGEKPGQEPGQQNVFKAPHLPPFFSEMSYLFTFKSEKPLDKLIYLDGASAAKSNTGEMDQQHVLSRLKDVNARVNEREAAKKICDWGKPFGLQGVVRLEIGFEIILCDFQKDLKVVSNITLNNVTELLNFPDESPNPTTDLAKQRTALLDITESMRQFEHLQAGENTNMGEARIQLDFSNMVTVINRTWLNPDPYLRRINNISDELKDELIDELYTILQDPVSTNDKTDWQGATNRMVDKFGPLLLNLNNSLKIFDHDRWNNTDRAIKNAATNLTQYTYNFIRRYSDDFLKDPQIRRLNGYNASVHDYVYGTYPLKTSADRLIYSAIHKVHHDVFNAIYDIFEQSKDILVDIYVKDFTSDEHTKIILDVWTQLIRLMEDLRWSVFTRCTSLCGSDEVCYSPTWGPGGVGSFFKGPEEANRTWFEPDGDRLKISKELSCVSYRDLVR